MNILVASAFPADSRFAHAINTIKMADGFAKCGHSVTLVCRNGKVPVSRERLHRDFGLSSVDVVQTRLHLLGWPLNPHRHFAWQTAATALRRKPDFAFCRNYLAPVALAQLGVPVVVESHAHPDDVSPALRTMVRALSRYDSFRGLVTIAPVLKENFIRLGAPPEKVWILPDAVDLDLFSRPHTLTADRNASRPRIVYAGHLYDYKGIPTILAAAGRLPGFDFVLIGGRDEDIARHRQVISERELKNVSLLGLLPHAQVPAHLWNADVLLLPPSANHPSAQWTSPVKLGEYLASGTPVVASRIPALEFWLKNDEVCFVAPDDPASLAQGIERVVSDSIYAKHLVTAASSFASTLSYELRCQQILMMAGMAGEGSSMVRPQARSLVH